MKLISEENIKPILKNMRLKNELLDIARNHYKKSQY